MTTVKTSGSLRLVVTCAVVVAATAAGPRRWARAAGAPSPTASDEEALIRRGVELRKARDDLAARAEFQKAYDMTHSPRAAAQLGLAEFALGRFDDAEVHVSEALRAQRDPWISKYRKELDQSLVDLQNHVARVEVIGEPVGAEVYVNGRLSGRLPLENPVAVSEGQVDVELRAPGFTRGSRTITLSGHQYQRLVIRLERERGGALAAPPPGSVRATAGAAGRAGVAGVADDSVAGADSLPRRHSLRMDTEPEPTSQEAGTDADSGGVGSERAEPGGPSVGRRIVKWTALGLAGAGLVTGVTAAVIAKTNLSTFQTAENGKCRDNGGQAINFDTNNPDTGCQPSLDAFHTARTWELVGFVAAGAFATTWLILLLTEPPERSSATTAFNRDHVGSWTCALNPMIATNPSATCAIRF